MSRKRILSSDRGKNTDQKKVKIETPTKKSPQKYTKKSPRRKNDKENTIPHAKDSSSEKITETIEGYPIHTVSFD